MKVKRYCPVGVGERLQRAMYDKNMDAVKLGSIIGIDRKTIYGYQHNDVAMSITICVKLCGVLGITPNYLLLGKE